MSHKSVIEVFRMGPVSAGARLFRFDGRLHIAVYGKVRLKLRADDCMRLVSTAPPELEQGDRYEGGVCVATSDVVPYRAATDVVLRSRVTGPRSTRLAILRPRESGARFDGAATVLDKRVELGVGRTAMSAFGPTGVNEPARKGLFAPEAIAQIEGPTPVLWTGMDFSYFHAAPFNQRPGFLRGDEWIYLERLHPTLERLTSQLPSVKIIGSLRLARLGNQSLSLHLDTLTIDVDAGFCDVVARGSFAIAHMNDLAGIVAAVTVQTSDEARQPAQQGTLAQGSSAQQGTLAQGSSAQQGAPTQPAAPAKNERPSSPPTASTYSPGSVQENHRSATMVLDVEPVPAPEPFKKAPAKPARSDDAPPPTVLPSALRNHTLIVEQAPSTRAPFALAKPRKAGGSSWQRPEIPGAPWARTPARAPIPARSVAATFDIDETLRMEEEAEQNRLPETGDPSPPAAIANAPPPIAPPARVEAPPIVELAPIEEPLAKPDVPPPAEPRPEPPAKKANPWRNLPQDNAPPPPPPPKPAMPKVGAASPELKKALYGRMKKG